MTQEREEPGVEARLARHGKVSYIEIPAADLEASASFYEALFGWRIERRDAAHVSFDDGAGELIGRWTAGRAISREPGFFIYIYVDDLRKTLAEAAGRGSEIVQPVYPEGNLLIGSFRDPAGNVIGIWQEQR